MATKSKLASLLACALSVAAARGQTRGDTRPADQVFKNVQVLKGIPADEFMSTMGFFSASLGITCSAGRVSPRVCPCAAATLSADATR